jgi:ArsR family transcriptional regulator, arsenate/arsenite/antimonite-responsive transcriptional repressor
MIEIPLLGQPHVDLSDAAASVLRLLADPTRRRIFLLLMDGDVCNCEMSDELGLAQNLISHHLRQLRQAGFIRARRDERDQRWVYYAIDRDVLRGVHRELGTLFDPDAWASASRTAVRRRRGTSRSVLLFCQILRRKLK